MFAPVPEFGAEMCAVKERLSAPIVEISAPIGYKLL
jgi:hypothetical protein